MIDVRPARLEDLPLLRKVAIESFIETFADDNTPENMEAVLKEFYSPDRLEKEWSEPGAISYLAWEGSTATGFVRVRRNAEVEHQLGKKTMEVQRLYVHPFHQGKKIGSLLMKNAEDYARENDCDWIWLGVWERNFKAQEFYAKQGFERFGEHVFQMGDDPQTDWLLRKKV